MDAGNRNEETIFHAAIEIDSPQERDAYVKSACGEDAELLSRVQGLLKYHFDNKSFLKSPAAAAVTLNESPATEKPGETIGRYKLLQQIGEGGFGVVYMAEQRHPIQRKVALKIIKLGMDTKQVIARFEAERQALAMMDHPNIAKVLDAGATATGRPYFVMELVKGIPVTEYCDKNDLDTHQRLKLFIDICKAVQHAHHKGIIHRDIKPSNIMITLRDDDSPVPKVIDFGIAKATQARLTEKTLFTEFRQFIGTPEYMSPEQARMGEMGVDTRSDVYSLGVLLYELLTGTTPFDSQTLRNAGYNEIQRIISEDEPPKPSTRLSTLGDSLADVARHRKMAPSQLRREIRGELDWIILKTLEKDRTRRYGSADELVLDIQRHLTHQPVAAGPPSKLYRMKKFSQRHRVEVMTAAAIVITLVIGFAVSTILYFQAEEARKKESTARAVAVKAKEETQRVNENLTWENYIASIGMAQRLVEKGDLAGARKLLLNCPEEYRNWEWGHLLYLCNPDLKSVKIDAKLIFHTSFSPDGKWLAVGGNQNLELWDGGMENKISTLPGRLAAFSTDGKYVAVAGGPKGIEASKHITIVDLTTFRKVKTFYGHDRGIKSLVFSPDGKLIASCDHAGVAMIHDVEGGNPLYQLDMPRLTCIAFSPDGKHLVTGQERESNSIRLWNAQTGALLGGHDSHLFSVHSVLFTPDSKTVISSSSTESDVLAWDIQTETVKKLPGLQKKSVDSLAMSKDGRHLAMKCRDGTVRLYDFKEQDEVHSFKGAGGFAPYDTFTPPIAFSPDGRRLVACDLRDSVVKVWNIEKFKNDYLRLTGHTGDINAMAFTPDGRYLVTGAGNWNSYPANDHTAKIWDLDTRHMIHGLVTHSGQVQGVAINLDGSLVATSTAWGLIDIWSLQTGAHIRRLESRDGYTYPLVFHPTENILVAGTTFSAQIWDVTTGQKLQSFKGHDEFVWSTDISPDGNFVASASFDKRINIWDRQSEKPIKEFLGHGGYVRDVAFSPDGTLLASASHDYTARIWDIALEKTIHILESNNDVLQVVFSPDGRRLLTASRHGTIKIWDVETGRELIELEHTLNLDPSIAMSRDGRTIAFGQEHDAVILFSFPWQLDQYPGDTSTPFEHRIEQYKRSFWQQWFNHKSTKMVSNSYALTEDPKRVSLAKYNDLLLDQVDMTPELLKEAVTDYTTAIQDSPNEWWLWKNRAMCYGKLENWDKAVADYTRAIEISPNDFELFNKRSLAYTNLGQQEK
ncbi:MAG: protein kinase domain-containing protein [Planctomycetota bacterium]|jgi:WD40 repeat protein/serine/threonine protein kinase